ncbi:hypothetical protein R1flu_025826 [Riccia fluitans]|uniref:Protein kinase domain-containing protein n=1 Tax=Riccia fluitans TaxID=41844 RepID=A0ABD1XYU6_9MARC
MSERTSYNRERGAPCLAPIILFKALQLLLLLDGNAALVPEEENLLESLRLDINEPSWPGDPCGAYNNISWIDCSDDSQHLTALKLYSMNLSGPIPSEVAKFTGLKTLLMQNNRLSGPIPDLSNMTQLENLVLNTNNLNGKIFNTTGFTNLTRIDLKDNNFTGGIPADLFKLRTLKLLYLNNNPLGGSLPDMSELTATEFLLPNTSINGTIPESIQNMTQVEQVVLSENPLLKGSIPNLSALVNLQYLDLRSCSLTGPLPDLKNAPNVKLVRVELNDLSGTIPPELFKHPKLIYLNLNNNSKISGEIPDTSELKEVTNFFLNDCNLTGPIPLSLQNNLKLNYIQLKNNHLTTCPPDFRNLTELLNFDVGNNSISGSLPEFYASSKLNYLIFRRNNFSGGIPMSWTRLTGVLEFQVEHNNLSGVLQKEIGDVGSLKVLLLHDNRFSGFIPKELGRLSQLMILDLSNNQFTGTVPEELAALPNLKKLILHNNNLTGIPEAFIKLGNKGLNLTYDATVHIIYGKSTPDISGGAIAGVVVGLLTLIAVFSIIIFLLFRRSKKRNCDNYQVSKDDLPTSTQVFLLREIKDITGKYKTVLGKGGYGTVYYGKLRDGKEVAVKVRRTESKQGVEEFLNEVKLLSRLHHRNLVPLVGYSLEGGQQTLIYAYMAEGSLHDHIYGKKSADGSRSQLLSWKTRLDIAINAAKGLEYLHKDCNPPVIHRDVKASNILLTQNLQARISDLGISKQIPEPEEEESVTVTAGVTTAVKGTFGYLDPEYFGRRRLTTKSDVYSFGMVLLEMITRKSPQSYESPDGSDATLAEWVKDAVGKDQVDSIIDPALESDYDKTVMLKVLKTALSCLLHESVERPDIGDVLISLTEALEAENKLIGKEQNSRTLPYSGQLSSPMDPGLSSFDQTWSTVNTEALPLTTDVYER